MGEGWFRFRGVVLELSWFLCPLVLKTPGLSFVR